MKINRIYKGKPRKKFNDIFSSWFCENINNVHYRSSQLRAERNKGHERGDTIRQP